jgi:outer membrane autotransporter protein
MMKRLRGPLLSSTALAGLILGMFVAPAAAAPLVVSAPASGATLTPSGDLLVDLLTVGDKTGESGTLTIGTGIGVNATAGGIIGNETGATGTVTVSGTGASLTVDEYLKVGNLGTGALTFENGASGTVTGVVYVGDYDNLQTPTKGGTGHLSVDGAGTNVLVDLLDVRSYGSNVSSVSVTGGAHLTTLLNFYGRGNSDIYVNGAGTVLKVGARDDDDVTYDNADGWFSVDNGNVLISGGAVLDSDGSYIGGDGIATMTVTGAGTRWVNGLPLFIGGTGNGNTGTGTVTIADGAYARGATVAVGVDEGSTGTLTVTGQGTILEVVANAAQGSPGNFRAGSSGTGTVTVSDGGLIKAANQISIASFGTSVGVLNIGAAEGADAAAAGYLDGGALGVVFGEGDATLVFNHTDTNYVFDQVMSGSGATIKHLAGTTRMTGYSGDLQGTAYVTGGALYANAYLDDLDVEVSGAGLLGGTGKVDDVTVKSGGTLNPGDGIGTLTVDDDLEIEAGGTLAIQLTGHGSDQVEIDDSGDVTIWDGALLDLTLATDLDPTESYRIIDFDDYADLDVDGSGFIVDDHAALVDSLVTYDEDEGVSVQFEAVTDDWAGFVETENQKATAAAVQALGLGNSVFNGAMFLSDDEIGQGFDLLSGEIHASTQATLLGGTQWLRHAALGRLDELAAPKESAVLGYAEETAPSPFDALTPGETTSTGWFTGFGGFAESGGNGNAGDTETRTGGVIGGIDTEIAGWRIGLVGGYGHDAAEAADRASRADIDTLYLGTYAGADFDGWRVKTGGGLGLSQLATERDTFLPDDATLSADYGAWTGQVFGELGYALKLGSSTIEPFGQLALFALSRDGYSETGGTAALSADADTSGLGLVTLGIRASNLLASSGDAPSLEGEIAWQHAVGDLDGSLSQSFAGGDAFTVAGAPIAADTLALQLALEQPVGTRMAVGIVYDGAFADRLTRHSLSGRLEAKF